MMSWLSKRSSYFVRLLYRYYWRRDEKPEYMTILYIQSSETATVFPKTYAFVGYRFQERFHL